MNNKLICAALVMLAISTFLPILRFPVAGAGENEWTGVTSMPTARGGLGVAVVNGKIYAMGGLNDNVRLAVNEEYDPIADSWRTLEPMPTARSGFAVAVFQNKITAV